MRSWDTTTQTLDTSVNPSQERIAGHRRHLLPIIPPKYPSVSQETASCISDAAPYLMAESGHGEVGFILCKDTLPFHDISGQWN